MRLLPEWWNGRHEGLKIPWLLQLCGFESRFGHYTARAITQARAVHVFLSIAFHHRHTMHFEYSTTGTCSRLIEFDIDSDNRLHNVRFTGGCHGNLQGIGALVEGEDAHRVAERLRGIRCGAKPTSCPDQLACALEQAATNSKNH